MLGVLRRRDFALLLVGQWVSSIGDVLLLVALPYYVYERAGSALATGAMFIAQTAPRVALGSLAGVFVDRWDRKRTMVWSDVLRATVLLALLLAQAPDRFWLIYLVAGLQAAIGLFFIPARSALVPRILPRDELVPANALGMMTVSVAGLVGPPLGGLLTAALGLPAAVVLDSASFLVSAAAIALIRTSGAPGAPGAAGAQGAPDGVEASELSAGSTASATPTTPTRPALTTSAAGAWRRVWRDWWEGVRAIGAHAALRTLTLAHALNWLGAGITSVLFVIFLRQQFGGGAIELGWWLTAMAAGGVAAGALAGAMGRWIAPLPLVITGYALVGATGIAMASTHSLPLALGCAALSAAASTAYMTGLQSVFQAEAPDAQRGRVMAGLDTTVALATLAGMAAGSALGDLAGAAPMFIAAGCIRLLAAAPVLGLLVRGRQALSPGRLRSAT